jgi:hypothetical protein
MRARPRRTEITAGQPFPLFPTLARGNASFDALRRPVKRAARRGQRTQSVAENVEAHALSPQIPGRQSSRGFDVWRERHNSTRLRVLAERGARGSGKRRLRHRGQGVRREAASVRCHQAHVPAPGRDERTPQGVRARSEVGRGRPPRKRHRHLRRRGPAYSVLGDRLHRRANLAAEDRRNRSAGTTGCASHRPANRRRSGHRG